MKISSVEFFVGIPILIVFNYLHKPNEKWWTQVGQAKRTPLISKVLFTCFFFHSKKLPCKSEIVMSKCSFDTSLSWQNKCESRGVAHVAISPWWSVNKSLTCLYKTINYLHRSAVYMSRSVLAKYTLLDIILPLVEIQRISLPGFSNSALY